MLMDMLILCLKINLEHCYYGKQWGVLKLFHSTVCLIYLCRWWRYLDRLCLIYLCRWWRYLDRLLSCLTNASPLAMFHFSPKLGKSHSCVTPLNTPSLSHGMSLIPVIRRYGPFLLYYIILTFYTAVRMYALLLYY